MFRMITIKLGKVLEERNKTVYALAKETGVAYNQLNKIKKNKVRSMSLDVMEKICLNLKCLPNDLFSIELKEKSS